jgi:hypothetical protein
MTNTVFPRIVSAETILFWKLKCGKYSREESIQGRKLLFFFTFWKWKLEYWSQLDFEIQAKKDAKSKQRRILKSKERRMLISKQRII